jgi:glycosyltransferase involved in cell wall biosynthesis
MNVALITDGIWPYVLGGMQKHSYYLCKYLAQNQVHVDLVHFNNSTYNIDELEFFSIEEKKFIHHIIVDFPKGDKLPGHYIRSSRKHSKLIVEAIKDDLGKYDFIYTKGFTGWELIEQKKKGKIKCAPIGVKFHGYEMFQKMPGARSYLESLLLLRKPVTDISKNADHVFSYGGKITEIIENLGVKKKNIIEIPSGVEEIIVADKISTLPGTIKFLFLGRYERRKGVEELNKALEKLKGDFEFHFIGPIPEEKRMKKKNLHYHGEIRDKNKLAHLMREYHVLVCPSWSEGMPNVVLEAMANGMAVAATDVGATGVLVNEETGWLIPSSSSESILKILKDVLESDHKHINEKRRNALETIKEKFTWEKLGKQLIIEIEKVSAK